jgi:hypothetical protein
MSNEFSYDAVVSHLGSQSDAIGRLAQDAGAFAAAVAAFESKDPDAFRWVLNHQEMLPYCELICYWVRVKMCVLRCFEVCGLPQEKVTAVNLQQFGRAIVQLASNEKLLRRVVDAVSCGDGDDYRAAINELKLNDYCHLLCHWVCAIIFRRVCERICTPIREPLADAASEIRAASRVFAKLGENEKALQEISKAAVELDCGLLGSSIQAAGFGPWCETICCWICVWWCAYACREVCGVPDPIRIEVDEIEEARNFALAARKLAAQPRALGELVKAVRNRDAKAYGEIVARYGLRPYCYQLCAWVCSGICYEFCICVCPPTANPPLFYQVGNFDIYSQIDPTSGRTDTSLARTGTMPYGGGPNFAFFEQLQLGGWCPATSPTFPGTPMMFRFLYAKNQTTLAAAITSSVQATITVASNAGIPPTPFNISVCYSDAPYETAEIMTVNNAATTTWTVVRGVEGSTPAASVPVGAIVAINPQPITGSLVDTPIAVGAHTISWPNHSGTTTLPGFSPTLETVYVGPGTDPPTPPVGPGTYVDPAHYIQPDVNGWVDVDQTLKAGGVSIFLWFDSAQVTPATCEIPTPCFGTLGTIAGSPVPAANQAVGTDFTIIFQASRVGVTAPVDYSNSLCKIHINNWALVNNLWLVEFGVSSCCNPIDSTLSVEFTVDHEEMDAGAWSLFITSCSASAPGCISSVTSLAYDINAVKTSFEVARGNLPSSPFNALASTGETMTVNAVAPTVYPGPITVGTDTWTVTRGAAPPVTPAEATLSFQSLPGANVTPRGGWGTIVENTTTWTNCSYAVWLYARPGLTTGLQDFDPGPNLLTFCICGHGSLAAPVAAAQAKKR